MPFVRSRRQQRISRGAKLLLAAMPLTVGVIGALPEPAAANPETVLAVRSRYAALDYRLVDTDAQAEIELWYTRDRGTTWQRWGIHQDHTRQLVFDAPGEGLYGFLLTVREPGTTPSPSPTAHAQPQRWVFIDYSPPLVQWNNVEPGGAFASRRIVHLRWTAHDDNLPRRPVALFYQSSVDQTWHAINAGLPNTGRYDWKVPLDLAGQITLKLAVRDLGGHVVERLHGPVPLDRWLDSPVVLTPPTSRPAGDDNDRTATPQAVHAASRPSLPDQHRAEQLYQRGSYHLVRSQYPLAAERFREALELDPDMLPALNDLAGIHYLQKDYDKAIECYSRVLQRDQRHQAALQGAALAHVARRQYPQSREMLERLLATDEKDAEAWLDLGDVLFMMGNHVGALSSWSQAADVDELAEEIIGKAQRRMKLYGPANATRTADARPRE